MKRVVRKHPLAVRWFHWINFPLLLLMIWSGVLIYWANAVYRVGIGDWTLFTMNLDQATWRALRVNQRLAEGMALHFFFMWLFAVNGVLYVVYTIVSGEWRALVPNRRSFHEAIHVVLHDLHLRRDPPPPRKFNGAQQIAYTSVILMGLGSLLTGLAIYKPVQFFVAGRVVRRLSDGEVLSLLADGRLRRLLRRAHRPGRPRRLEQLPGDGDRLRGPAVKEHETIDGFIAHQSRRGFLTMGVAAAVGFGAWKYMRSRPREQNLARPFRRMLEANESLARAYFEPSRLTPTFRPSDITKLRANGHLGLKPEVDAASWRLNIEGAIAPAALTVDAIREFPAHEMIAELRCIEGWSMITKWKGARLRDVIERFPPPSAVPYLAMETPGRGYYVGLDMESALHPQTLLVYEMNDQPLTWRHGAPLRLAIPVKYGIKNIKRIGTMRYTNVRPADYWAERAYDWYAGL